MLVCVILCVHLYCAQLSNLFVTNNFFCHIVHDTIRQTTIWFSEWNGMDWNGKKRVSKWTGTSEWIGFWFYFRSIRLPFRSAVSTIMPFSTDVCWHHGIEIWWVVFSHYARQFVAFSSFSWKTDTIQRTYVAQLTSCDIFDHYNYLCFNRKSGFLFVPYMAASSFTHTHTCL